MNQPASGLRHQPPPALADYSGPPNGDYVRYVEQLMQWSEQEHRRTGGFALPTAQPHAGQVGAKAQRSHQGCQQERRGGAPGDADAGAKQYRHFGAKSAVLLIHPQRGTTSACPQPL